jgi:hypothetical protein
VIPVSPIIVVYFLLIYAVLAMGTGAATGAVASFSLRLPMRGILTDALLGTAGFLIGFAVTVLVRPLGSPLVNHFISPIGAALVVSPIFPLLRAISRFRHLRSR